MILPESLHPSMTRHGFGKPHGVSLKGRKPSDFPITSEGIWLPELELSGESLRVARHQIGSHALATSGVRLECAEMAYDGVATADLDDSGCWVPSLNINDNEHVAILWRIAEQDMGVVLNPRSTVVRDALHICTSAGCLNTRHYDFTHGVSQRRELLEVQPSLYKQRPDGTILTAWGDILPSIAESAEKLNELQIKCPPYAEHTTSPLTANGISKITIDETTGCWIVRSYYTKDPAIRGFQYDGYGRLTLRKHLRPAKMHMSSQQLAHRVLWVATGRELRDGMELNHLCGFRPCGNPAHLVQVSKSENGKHAYRMKEARLKKETAIA